jgi:hypothetical protein
MKTMIAALFTTPLYLSPAYAQDKTIGKKETTAQQQTKKKCELAAAKMQFKDEDAARAFMNACLRTEDALRALQERNKVGYEGIVKATGNSQIEAFKIGPKWESDTIPKRTPLCPRLDIVALEKGNVAIKVNDRTIGRFSEFTMSHGPTASEALKQGQVAFAMRPIDADGGKVKMDPPCQLVPIAFKIDPIQKRFHIGEKEIGSFGSFAFSPSIVEGAKSTKGDVTEFSGHNSDTRYFEKGDGDKKVKEKVISVILSGARGAAAAGAAIGIILTPSTTGCAALHGC